MAINRNKVLSKRDLEGEARKDSFETLNRVLRQVQTLSSGNQIQLDLKGTSPVSVNIDWEKLTEALGVEATKNIEFLIKELARDDISLRFHSHETGPRRLYALSNPAALADALSNLIITLTRKDGETKEYDKGAIAQALQAVEAASAYSVTYRYRRQRIRDAIKISMGILGPLAFVGGLFALAIVVFLFPVSLPFVGLVATLGVMGAGAVCLLGALGIKIFERRRYYSGSTWDELSSPLGIAAKSAGLAHQFVKGVINFTGTTPGQPASENPNLVILQNNRRRKLELLNSDLARIKTLLEISNLLDNEKILLQEMKALVLERINMMNHATYLSEKQVKLALKNRKAPVDKSDVPFDVNKGTLLCPRKSAYPNTTSLSKLRNSPLSKDRYLASEYAGAEKKQSRVLGTDPELFFTHSRTVNRAVHRLPELNTLFSHHYQGYSGLPGTQRMEWGRPTPGYVAPPPAKRVSSGYSSGSDGDSGFNIFEFGALAILNAGMSKR